MAVKDYGTRSVRRSWTPLIITGSSVVGILGALMFTVFDLARFEHDNAFKPSPTPIQRARYAPVAKAEWRQVRANLEARLDQREPLELGAVWATRAGQICGLVNGRGSFGGLTAMTRFYTVDQQPVFHQDIEHIAFQKAWFECRRDPYVMLHEGTTEPGFCGTELGKRRCYAVKNGVRVE
ncbi:hypothetical protein [Caulobacter sp. BP25]|uniref:hypothetical protein n=1 Tax=Caulobacter sp. BP25 TaxID=2048900 RepID=UPI000C12AF07|nr:hypothetical protein [Caulobacter sp. BP25]PHY17228.1 hypothetical protein CSW59_19555 [Caulobacter sp. BP25]